MRFKEITVSGFGGISNEVTIDLNADVVILVGANGYGKTTVCNAVSWVLSGKSHSTQGPRNLYSKSTTTKVDLTVVFNDHDVMISRSLENPDEADPKKFRSPLRIRTNNDLLRGAEAEVWLRRHLAGTETDEDFDTLAESFVDSMYLKQESLRQFLTGREDTERFDAVASMVGAGRLREFADQLQSHKRSWVRSLNQADNALDNERVKIEDLAESLIILDAEISRVKSAEVAERWHSWVEDAQALGVGEASKEGLSELTEESLSSIRSSLNKARRDVEQDESSLLAIQAELQVQLPDLPNEAEMSAVSAEIAEVSRKRDAAQAEVESLRPILAALESSMRQASSLREDLASMAGLLLRHVSDTCAACGQTVNQAEYHARLEAFVTDSEDTEQRASVEGYRRQLSFAETRAHENFNQLATLADQRRSFEEEHASATAVRRRRENRLREIVRSLSGEQSDSSINLENGLDLVQRKISGLSGRRQQIVSVIESGNRFEAAASIEASRARYVRLSIEVERLRTILAEKESDIAARRATSDVASQLLEAVKTDAESFVADRLKQLSPLLSQFYAAIDPHPTFRAVEITTRQFGGKHRLTPLLRDLDMKVDVANPGETLSTSQANALAVSLFLAFNLGFSPTHVNSLLLDDPLQNLDDVHLLGLVDLLRKVVPSRQIVVTTHDHAFASLLARKLRPVADGARTTYVHFTKWDRNGPGVEQWDVPTEKSPLKLISG